MTSSQWTLIALLAAASYGVRLAGLFGGRALAANPRLKPLLHDLPGCLIVGLVAASLADASLLYWAAAAVALSTAILTGNLVITMLIGMAVIVGGGALL
ncbi:branched-chain amino acid transporter [Pseudohalocynthiibacter aestuariivivens]|uniref:AzlD domain-containing protein n=1 Tax=Roseovarius pelagicus TaxID=2980108 RepID=A0ABY6D944_9RHOB|nr:MULTISPECIES: AzlD domain-containing protein [Rhodobacterales]QIE45426.1 branched-chain amino acid transporter [Pseudohalocynthiibacter aestuariivivens]UXX82656.1 AzlD domain-containing protein [Roseovarius pelagicus]